MNMFQAAYCLVYWGLKSWESLTVNCLTPLITGAIAGRGSISLWSFALPLPSDISKKIRVLALEPTRGLHVLTSLWEKIRRCTTETCKCENQIDTCEKTPRRPLSFSNSCWCCWCILHLPLPTFSLIIFEAFAHCVAICFSKQGILQGLNLGQ